MGLYVNGEKIDVISSFSTDFEIQTFTATLVEGPNTVAVIDSENSDELNIDYLEVSRKAGQIYYDRWALEQNAPEDGLSNFLIDSDQGGLSNLGEYALNGDPSVFSDDLNRAPVLLRVSGGANGFMEYTFQKRRDAEERGLIYIVEHTTSLGSGNWDTSGVVLDSEEIISDEFAQVTVHIPSNGAAYKFARLRLAFQ